MKILTSLALLTVAAATLTRTGSATELTPGGPAQAVGSTSVTPLSIVYEQPGTVSSGSVSASYNEMVIKDGNNPYGSQDLTFLIAVGNGTAPIQGVTIGNVFSTPSNVSVGYIAGAGDFGADIPLTAQESSDGTVQFNFSDLDVIGIGAGTQYVVMQTSASSLPSGDVGIISIVPAAPAPVAATPEPGTLLLLCTGLATGAGALLRTRRRIAA